MGTCLNRCTPAALACRRSRRRGSAARGRTLVSSRSLKRGGGMGGAEMGARGGTVEAGVVVGIVEVVDGSGAT
jgi:hypothetical protein